MNNPARNISFFIGDYVTLYVVYFLGIVFGGVIITGGSGCGAT